MLDAAVVLRDIAAAAGVTVFVDYPDDVTSHLPCVVLTELGGRGLWPEFHEQAGFSYAGWATTRRGAMAVARAARVAWHAAARSAGPATSGGRLGRFRDDVSPAPTPTGMVGVFRADGTCTVTIRPA